MYLKYIEINFNNEKFNFNLFNLCSYISYILTIILNNNFSFCFGEYIYYKQANKQTKK